MLWGPGYWREDRTAMDSKGRGYKVVDGDRVKRWTLANFVISPLVQ